MCAAISATYSMSSTTAFTSTAAEWEAEIRTLGDVMVMSRGTVDGPPYRAPVDRRFTNVWQRREGRWLMIARHAQIVADRPAPPRS